ncbi:MAG: hypothetical protein KAJ40_00670 [Alphaproteobacteria bacterium]|nr:hypothetical protein [Alphaproteobacteria bacterium]
MGNDGPDQSFNEKATDFGKSVALVTSVITGFAGVCGLIGGNVKVGGSLALASAICIYALDYFSATNKAKRNVLALAKAGASYEDIEAALNLAIHHITLDYGSDDSEYGEYDSAWGKKCLARQVRARENEIKTLIGTVDEIEANIKDDREPDGPLNG